ncbi:hypothetical protein FKM82_029520 [Ascaphus truei]
MIGKRLGLDSLDYCDHKLGVGPEMDMVEYCRKEWRGKTAVAKLMKELKKISSSDLGNTRGCGYEAISHVCTSLLNIR